MAKLEKGHMVTRDKGVNMINLYHRDYNSSRETEISEKEIRALPVGDRIDIIGNCGRAVYSEYVIRCKGGYELWAYRTSDTPNPDDRDEFIMLRFFDGDGITEQDISKIIYKDKAEISRLYDGVMAGKRVNELIELNPNQVEKAMDEHIRTELVIRRFRSYEHYLLVYCIMHKIAFQTDFIIKED